MQNFSLFLDVKIFNSELNKKNAIIESNFSEKSLQSIELINQTRSNVSATGANGDKLTNPDEIALKTTSDVQEKVKEENAEVEEGEEEEEEEEDPSLIVRFDYVDIEDLPKEEQIIEDVVSPNGNKSKETLIILKNDDSGKKIFLKTSSIIEGPGGTVFEDERWESEAGVEEVAEKKQTTTPKAFIYSPTIPQATLKKVKTDETTIKYNTTEGESKIYFFFVFIINNLFRINSPPPPPIVTFGN